MEKVTIVSEPVLGSLWCIGWLFTIGFLKLSFWRGVLALVVWPYFLGKKFTKEVEKVEEKKSE